MKKTILTIALITVFCIPYKSFAAESDIGTTTFPVLELGFGARGAAMGNAFCGVVDDISALWWNPAGLGQLQFSEVSFSHQQWFQDFKDEYGGVAYCTDMGVLAAGVVYSSVSGIEGYPDEPGAEYNDPTNFKTYDVVGSLAYGRQFKKNLYCGVSFLGYYMNLDPHISGIKGDIGKAFGTNLGFLWRPRLLAVGQAGIGLSVQNLGTTVHYLYHASDRLPTLAKLGFSLSPTSKINGTVELTMPQFGVISYGVGLEYWLSPIIALRGGYRGGPQAQEYFPAKDALSVGFGIRYLKIGLDYAYAPYWDFGMTHRISLSYQFGEPQKIKTGTIIAKVIDSETKKPMQAIVITKGPRNDTLLTTPKTGERKIVNMPIGKVIVKAEKDFYTSAEDTVILAWYDITTVELALKYTGPENVPREKAVKGIFGKVSNIADGAPIMADIKYIGPVSGVVTNDTSGWYSIPQIPTGIYTLTIESKGHEYFPKIIKEVVVQKNKGTLVHAELGRVKTLRLYFERSRAYVHPNDMATLDTLAAFIQQYKENTFEIHGHTDSRTPTRGKDNNMELSYARATAVKNYLVSRGVANERLVVKGFGATKSVASNDTEEGMAVNRRIEIIMLPPQRNPEGYPPVKQSPAETPKPIEQKPNSVKTTPLPGSTKK